MKKKIQPVDPKTYPDKEDDSFKIHMDWGWQVDGMFYALVANFLLVASALISLLLRK